MVTIVCFLSCGATFLCAYSIKFAPVSLTSLIQNAELFIAITLDHIFIEKAWPNTEEFEMNTGSFFFVRWIEKSSLEVNYSNFLFTLEITGALCIFVSTTSIPMSRLIMSSKYLEKTKNYSELSQNEGAGQTDENDIFHETTPLNESAPDYGGTFTKTPENTEENRI